MNDFEKLAESIDALREVLRAMVAGLMADGFTEEQARSLIVSGMAQSARSKEESDERK